MHAIHKQYKREYARSTYSMSLDKENLKLQPLTEPTFRVLRTLLKSELTIHALVDMEHWLGYGAQTSNTHLVRWDQRRRREELISFVFVDLFFPTYSYS